MIEEFYLKNNLSFNEVKLSNLEKGLIVFTGPSGSGKSVLMNSILSLFGLNDLLPESSNCVLKSKFSLEEYGINNEEGQIIINQSNTAKGSAKFFVNNTPVSKKVLKEISKKITKHLSLRDYSDFENENLIILLDEIINEKEHFDNVKEFSDSFNLMKKMENELKKLEEENKNKENIKEFILFEIDKIKKLNPKVEEEEELLLLKKRISKKDKILESINELNLFFELEGKVDKFLSLNDINSDFFSNTMEQLRREIDNISDELNDLSDIDIENVLDRIEAISKLNKKYGSIEDALNFVKEKESELEHIDNLEYERDFLIKKIKLINDKLNSLEKIISQKRVDSIYVFNEKINEFTNNLYLENVSIKISKKQRTFDGIDQIDITLNNTQLTKVSTGEFNRLRLAVLAIKSGFIKDEGGVLFLDEIDANLSGEESMSVAKVLKTLANKFQIFAISHQPQLTSKADIHIKVNKKDNVSFVEVLEKEDKIQEIGRMISGEEITHEAMQFAKKLFA